MHTHSPPIRRCLAYGLAAATSFLPLLPSVSATTKTWSGADGTYWNTPAAWTPTGVPVNGDDVIMGTIGTGSITANYPTVLTGSGLTSLKLNAVATGLITFNQSDANSVMIATTEIIGDTVTGNVYTQNAGTNTATTLIIGNGSVGSGIYNLSGNGSLNVGTFKIGIAGYGTVNQSAGTVMVSTNLYVGQNNTLLNSTYNLTGGNLTLAANSNLWISGYHGSFNQSDGTVNFLGTLGGLYMSNGSAAGVNNTYTLSGTGQITNANYEIIGQSAGTGTTALFIQSGGTNSLAAGGTLTVGNQGVGEYDLIAGSLNSPTVTISNLFGGSFKQTGGTNILGPSGILNIALTASVTGSYTMDNTAGTTVSTLTAGTENIGIKGIATFTQAAGTNTANLVVVGQSAGSSATYNLSGGNVVVGSAATPGQLIVGQTGTNATFTQTGGSVASNGAGGLLSIADKTGSSGSYLLKNGTLNADTVYVGNFGTGTFNQTGGTQTIAGLASTSGLFVGLFNTGSYNLSNADGTAVLTAAHEYIGCNATGTFTQSDGTHTLNGDLQLGVAAGVTGTYNLNGGVLNANANIGVGIGGTGVINQTNGTLNVTGGFYLGSVGTSTGKYTLSAGSFSSGSVFVGSAGSGQFFQSGGTAVVTGSLYIGSSNGAFCTFHLSGGTLTTPSAIGGFTVNKGGFFSQIGGTFNGYLNNAGTFTYYGGTFNGTLENAINGTLTLNNTSLLANAGVINKGIINLPLGIALSSGTSGTGSLDNESTITLAGGSLGGSGIILNNGSITGYGTIGGSGGFANFGSLAPGDGNFAFSNSGINNNYGAITLVSGRQFQITTGSLNNNASITLNGALLSGAGTLSNNAGGTLAGPGIVSSSFQNLGGTVAPGSGTLSITTPWTNAGLVLLTGPTSSLAGGSIINNSTIQGVGTVGCPITNNGMIEAMGGTLYLSGTLTNPAAGALITSAGNKLLISTGMASNAGLISLLGGTFDNNSLPLNNTGQITGYGTLRTGGTGLTNNGSLTLTGTNGALTTTINGNVTNNTGKTINIKYNPAIFTGTVVNNAGATIKTTSTTATFAGGFTNNGIYLSDPSSNIFQADVTAHPDSTMSGGVGDQFIFVGGTFANSGTFTNSGLLQSSDTIINTGTFTQTGILSQYANFTNSGKAVISGSQTWGVGSTFTNNAGAATFGTDPGTSATRHLALTVTGGTVTANTALHLASLATFGTGTLNLTTHDLFLASGSIASLTDMLYYHRLLTSSATPGVALAPVTGAQFLALHPGAQLRGQTVLASDILAVYTYAGDVNLDGQITAQDFAQLDAAYLKHKYNGGANDPKPTWLQGDLNYDGKIDASDFAIMDASYLQQTGTILANDPFYVANLTTFGPDYADLVSQQLNTVPEPGSLLLLGLASVGLLARRKMASRQPLDLNKTPYHVPRLGNVPPYGPPPRGLTSCTTGRSSVAIPLASTKPPCLRNPLRGWA